MNNYKFFVCPNVGTMALSEGEPWSFNPPAEELENVRKMAKTKRRQWALDSSTAWNVYTPVRAQDETHRSTKDNPPYALRGFVADYDLQIPLEDVEKYVGQMPENFRPQKVEVSLSKRIRLVWIFERELLIPSTAFAGAFLKDFATRTGLRTALPGYDQASEKVQQVWTNGGEWYDYKEDPVPWSVVFGIASKLSNTSNLFGTSEIPLDVIQAEVERRFPGRWTGPFELEQTGVRFWDSKADNPTGCQVKPDGMLCFTGRVPFVRWQEIFGNSWVQEQEVLQLGAAGAEIYFDGKSYWEKLKGSWETCSRSDVILRLKNRGVSDRLPRGRTVSDVERVLNFIQVENRIEGAAPLVNYPKGIVDITGRRLLNTTKLCPVLPADKKDVTPADFPVLHETLFNMFAEYEDTTVRPVHYFLAWFQRSYDSILNHKRTLGQAIFMCGPGGNGKTLLCVRVVAPLLGGKYSNPYSYYVGDTGFNDDLFWSYLWAINDEEAPKNEAARHKFIHKMKSAVVNPDHTYSPKFLSRISIPWSGRNFFTLNDDALSIGLLPELTENTMDKMMFFLTTAPKNPWPDDIEEIIQKELPYFAKWLLEVYVPPAEVMRADRMGVKPYFDKTLLDQANHQCHAYNLIELIGVWTNHSGFFDGEDKPNMWSGTPTDLAAHFAAVDSLSPLLKDWTVPRIAKALSALARTHGSGVKYVGVGEQRTFTIHRSIYDRTKTS